MVLLLAILKDKSNWVIEYGNFPEVAGNPHVNLHEMVQEMQRLIVAEMMIAQKNNTQLLDFSYHPTQDAAQVVPAERPRYMMMYKHQTDPSNRVAINGATTQFNLDLNQDNYVLQMEALTYLAVLLPAATWNGSIAYNPETERVDADNGLLTQRPKNWQEGFAGNAPGPLLMALNAGFSHHAYVDMMEKIPMIIKTTDDGGYVDAYNDNANDYIKRGAFTMSDARNLLKSVRSDIRITMPGVVEFRPLDSGSFKENMGIGCMLYAINENRQALEDIIKIFHDAGLNDPEKLMDFRTQIISSGLRADNGKATELYKQVLHIANMALAQRNLGEEAYLQPLRERVESGVTPAEQKRELFNDNKGDVISVIQSNVLLPNSLIFDNVPDNDRFIDQQRAQYRNKLSGRQNSYVSSQEKQFGFAF
ncbi:MAG: glutamate-cysteine ligase family protein [Alphaproteobacteria bacterium]